MNHARTIFMEAYTLIMSFFRQKSTIAWMIVIPIILSLTCTSVISAVSDNEVILYIQDQDDNNISKEVVEDIKDFATVVMVDKTLTEQEALEEMKKDSRGALGLIVIPKGFKENWYIPTSVGESAKIMFHYGDKTYEIAVKKTTTPSGESEPSVTMNDLAKTSLIKELLGKGNLYKQFTPAIVIGIMSLIVMGFVIGSRTSLRKNGVSIMTMNTELKRWHTVLANMLWTLIPAAITCLITYSIINIFFPVEFNADILLVLFLSSLCITSLGLVISMLVRNTTGSSVVSAAILLPLIIVSGGLIPLSFMPDWAVSLSYFSPITYMISGFKYSLGVECSIDYGTSLLALLGITIGLSLVWIICERKSFTR